LDSATLTLRSQANPVSPFPARKPKISPRGSRVSSSAWLKRLRYGVPFLAGAAALAGMGGALFAWSGLYDVAASAGHLPITRDFLQYVMKQSVAFHAPHLKAPPRSTILSSFCAAPPITIPAAPLVMGLPASRLHQSRFAPRLRRLRCTAWLKPSVLMSSIGS
jgi:hypothetical protein